MKDHLVTALAAVALATVPAVSASACSVVDDYRVPTNLELVEGAELIMLGRVVGEKQTGEDEWDRAILVEPVSAIKGTLPGGQITLEGMSLTEGEYERYGVFSNPYELEGAHPTSYIGGCTRYFFPRGTTALFFLEREDGAWRSAGGPFSRWAEDVLTDNAPWLRLTRFYAEVAAAPGGSRNAMLQAEQSRLSALGDDPVARMMAQDVARQLEGPNETWNAMMQRAIEGDGDIDASMAAEAVADAIADLVMETTQETESGDAGAHEPDETDAEDQPEATDEPE
jgi:hypothetical protein